MAVNSNINVSNIDENFPLPGINQSSQTFRSNTIAIKNSLAAAKTEITNLQRKQIVLTPGSDVIGLSDILDSGSAQVNMQLVLKTMLTGTNHVNEPNVLYQSPQIRVDSKGRIIEVFEGTSSDYGVAGTYEATETKYGTGALTGTQSITIPSFTLNASGQVTATDIVTIDGLGILDHPMQTGSLLVGQASKSAVFDPPPATGDLYYLSTNVSGQLQWQIFPQLTDGTVTNLVGGKGIVITNPTTTPTIDFDSTEFPAVDETNLDLSDYLLFHDVSEEIIPGGQVMKRLLVQDMLDYLDGTFLKAINEDLAPQLGGDLDVNDKIITSTGGQGIRLVAPGGSQILLDGQPWPKTIGSDAQVLTVGPSGQPIWADIPYPAFPQRVSVVSANSSTDGLVTSPVAGITDTGSLKLEFRYLPTQTVDQNADLVVLSKVDGSLYKSTVAGILPPAASAPQIAGLFVSPAGNDTTGDGSVGKPYQTIQKAITQSANGGTVILLPGVHSETSVNLNKPNLSFVAWLGRSSTTVTGQFTVQPDMSALKFKDINFENTSLAGFVAASGVAGLRFEGCDFRRGNGAPAITLDGTQTEVIEFQDCLISGSLVNNLDASAQLSAVAVYLSNMRFLPGNGLIVQTGANSRTYVDDLPELAGAIHNGGELYLSNINSILPMSSSIDGIQSTAAAGLLSVRNARMNLFQIPASTNWTRSRINKTGAAPYYFENVVRDMAVDNIQGQRQEFATDVDSVIRNITLTGTGTLNMPIAGFNSGRVYDILPTGNMILNIQAPTSYTGLGGNRAFSYDFRAIVKQDGTGGRTVTFQNANLVWEKTGTQPQVTLTANSYTVYDFTWNTATGVILGRVSGGGGSNTAIQENITIAGSSYQDFNVTTLWADGLTTQAKNVLVQVTTLDSGAGPTNNMYVEATGVTTIAKSGSTVRIVNETTSSLTFTILFSR